jgi:hypothetical protein
MILVGAFVFVFGQDEILRFGQLRYVRQLSKKLT